MKTLLLIVAAACLAQASVLRFRRNAAHEYKMCVVHELLDLCNEMANTQTKSSAKITCIAARDRYQCLEKIKDKEADFGMVDPEDMYIAAKLEDDEKDFAVFEEIRTKEEPEAEFRYEAVAVIHKDLNINGIEGLKGLNSCHTGVGRNVGYKVPLTKLKQKGIIGNLADPSLSPRENELKAFSTLFNKACIVGKWSEDPKINLKWKKEYSNLCALCEDPQKCDYPDKFSGYDGALRCLAHNGGQVAWTKVIYVRKFFGLPVGTTPASKSDEKPEDFAYLCPDGTRVPITLTGDPCRWAARPWQGYMANTGVVKTVDELRKKIENLDSVGEKTHAKWLEKVLEIDEQKHVPHETKVISPQDYLDKANYTDVIERDYGPPFKTIKICVNSEQEKEKCKILSKSAFSRNIRPRVECVQSKNDDCMKLVQDNGADITTVDGGLLENAQRDFNLKPIMEEKYEGTGGAYYVVAVVKKGSSFQKLSDLKGAKSCDTGAKNNAGFNTVLATFIKKDVIKKTCPLKKTFSDFFGNANSFEGDTDAFKCLSEGADVAFVKHVTAKLNTDGNNKESWSENLKSSNYELLCADEGRKPLDQYEQCNLGKSPSNLVLTGNSKKDSDITEIQNALVSISNQYSKRSDLFKLFGIFEGKRDLIFQDSASGVASISEVSSEIQKEYGKVLSVVNSCA